MTSVPPFEDCVESLSIEGPTTLNGTVSVRGAKNAALPVLIAACAGTQPVVLDNVPAELNDVKVEVDALRFIGCEIDIADGRATVRDAKIRTNHLPLEFSSRFRYSLLFLGLLAGKCGYARVSVPGGCSLGDRKYDLHLEGLRQLGARVEVTQDAIEVSAEKLVGNDIHFYLPTTSGTENIMLAACFAQGRTRIFNANTRPEVADMAACLNKMGARISVKNRVVEIEGGRELGGCSHSIMPGWDEALTYALACGMTHGEICIQNFSLEHVRSDAAYLREAGIDMFEWGGNVYVSGKNKKLRPFNLFTAPYPGVNSDMQPLFAALASQCDGESTVTDQRFTERFKYVGELHKLGVEIEAYGNSAIIQGPCRLKGAEATALDLRCGAALILGALVAEGKTTIGNCYQVYRGYERIAERLGSLGARIEETT